MNLFDYTVNNIVCYNMKKSIFANANFFVIVYNIF